MTPHSDLDPMFVLLNGPLGIGKSSLGEALCEELESSAHIDGDALVALNPPAPEGARGREQLHGAIRLLVEHHRRFGARHFVINHVWFSPEDLEDLCARLTDIEPRSTVRCFRLCLDESENLRRIERRARARILDEFDFEQRTVRRERALLTGREDLGEPLDVSGTLEATVGELLLLLRT